MPEFMGLRAVFENQDSADFILALSKQAPNPSVDEVVLESSDLSWGTLVSVGEETTLVVLPETLRGKVIHVRVYDQYGREQFTGDGGRVSLLAGDSDLVHAPAPSSTNSRVQVTRVPPRKNSFWLYIAILLVAGWLLTECSSPNGRVQGSGVGNAVGEANLARYAVLAGAANLRSSPVLVEDNVIGEYALGTQFEGRPLPGGEFVSVRLPNGTTGYFSSRVVGDAEIVKRMSSDPMRSALEYASDQVSPIKRMSAQLKSTITTASLFNHTNSDALLRQMDELRAEVKRDETSAWFFYYQAKMMAASDSPEVALIYYQAAVRADPLFEDAIVESALSNFRDTKEVDEETALHSVFVAPESANSWMLVAFSRPDLDELTIRRAILQAIIFSRNRNMAKEFLMEHRMIRGAGSGLSKVIEKMLTEEWHWNPH